MDDNLLLLEVAFFQDGFQEWYDFIRDAMFIKDIDSFCDQYNFTFEDQEVKFTSYGNIKKYVICDEWVGEKYLVTRDRLDNYAIYQFGFEEDSNAN